LREGARIKLGHAGIYHLASPSAVLAMIPSIGRKSWRPCAAGAAQLGKPLQACRVVVVGDTPKDIAAAQAIGAECVAGGHGHALGGRAGTPRARARLCHPGRPPRPTLSCSGIMFPGWFGVDRHTSQVGDLRAQILFDALGEACASLMDVAAPRVQ